MGLTDDLTAGLDEPLPIKDALGFLKKNKIRVIIIYEDQSFKEFFLKFPNSYILTIKNKAYFLVPKCIVRGKYPTITYYYNNPCPIYQKYEVSELKAIDTYSDEQKAKLTTEKKVTLSNVFLDAETINLAFTTRIMRGLYANSIFTLKSFLIIFGVVVFCILLVLQLTGTVDVWGAITGQTLGAK